MKNSLLVIAACLATSVGTSAQTRVVGNKDFITKNVDVNADFTAIQVKGSPDVYYTQTSGEVSIEIYGASNIIPYVETIVKDGTLIVKYKSNIIINNSGKLEVRVSAPNVTAMRVSGSGDIFIEKGISTNRDLNFEVHGSGDIHGKKLKSNNLYVHVHGSGDIDFSSVDCSRVEANVHGSGDIALKGKARDAYYRVNGSGDISASNMAVNNVEARINGSGDISCYAIDKLTGNVRGSGDVGYKGNPDVDFPRKGLYKL
jgi:Protein of unknown function (DUF2807).